ncbi:MAG: hypothetical protein M3380_00960 [Chloroflexota bacterium]|nr:hypothetical protein [Chloroflexota bacterium]
MWELWSRRGYLSEGRRWLAAVLARSEAEPASRDARHLRAKALSAAGNLAVYQFDAVAGQALLEESLARFQVLGDTWWIAYVLLNLGDSAGLQGDHARAMSLLEESMGLFRRLGDRWGIAWALEFSARGLAASTDPVDARDRHDRALVLQEESLAHFRETGDILEAV